MKIKPIDIVEIGRNHQAKPVPKSRLKKLLERQFPGVRRVSSAERLAGGAALEPSSVCLDKMVRNFMEDSVDKSSSRCGRSRCNCFHGNCDDSSDEDLDFQFLSNSNSGNPNVSTAEVVKNLLVCTTVSERKLLMDASIIVDKCKNFKRRDEQIQTVANGLRSLGHDASVCKSRWENTSSFPAGGHEYIDIIIGSERLLVDVDFRSEFQIARPTKSYAAVLQSLPSIFIGTEDRVAKIVAVVSESARLSLKKRGLDFPPWRKPEYIRSKWLAPHERPTPPVVAEQANIVQGSGDSDANASSENSARGAVADEEPRESNGNCTVVDATLVWIPPEVKPKVARDGARLVAGLASVLSENR